MRLPLAVLGLLILLAPGPRLQADPAASRPTVELALHDVPHAVRTDSGIRFIYELHLTDRSGTTLRLQRLDVVDDSDGRVLASFAGEALARRFAATDGAQGTQGPTRKSVIYLE
ncbi:hypothetical protein [Fulvimonas yonginensis]|uniref:TonB C-terminal domain-containing protein n=1 Tax=Fulvimonas yonginensis TaxID=1495200 RepID=A0ABU8JFR2_9GAMM